MMCQFEVTEKQVYISHWGEGTFIWVAKLPHIILLIFRAVKDIEVHQSEPSSQSCPTWSTEITSNIPEIHRVSKLMLSVRHFKQPILSPDKEPVSTEAQRSAFSQAVLNKFPQDTVTDPKHPVRFIFSLEIIFPPQMENESKLTSWKIARGKHSCFRASWQPYWQWGLLETQIIKIESFLNHLIQRE